MTSLRSASATDTGLVRATNEDLALESERLWAVADGMGGHAAGEVASRTAIDTLVGTFANNREASGLEEAVRRANMAVWERGSSSADLRGMGTTMTAAALIQVDGHEALALVNVGDSRAYLHRSGQLSQLTEDHSLVEEMVRSGDITPEEATVHPQRHVLTRALGAAADVDVDTIVIQPSAGDRVLLCSDGLINELDDPEIAAILDARSDPQQAADELVRTARDHGGNDNITVVLIDVSDSAGAAAAPESPPAAEAPAPPPARERTRRITPRVVSYVLLVMLVIGGAIGAVGWFATRSYFVGLQGDRLTIYQGRPGGLLWFNPRVSEQTAVTTAEVLPSRLDDLRGGVEEPSLAAARRYVSNLVAEARSISQGPSAAAAGPPAQGAGAGDAAPISAP